MEMPAVRGQLGSPHPKAPETVRQVFHLPLGQTQGRAVAEEVYSLKSAPIHAVLTIAFSGFAKA